MTKTVSDPPALGRIVRETRRALGLTQPKLALSAGVGVRFLVD
jgi:transcriptional regulator with XRE-family HTH domain